MPEGANVGEVVLRGIPVSAGVCRGRIVVLGRDENEVPQYAVAEADVPQELQRLEQALIQTRQQIQKVQQAVGTAMGSSEASIFEAHLLILEDVTLLDEVTRKIQKERVNVESAFQSVAEKYARTLEKIDDTFLRERVADVRDVATRVLGNLTGRGEGSELRGIKEPCLIISHDLSPSITAQLDTKLVLGFGTDIGGPTSHTAIMARSLRIPAVVGLHDASIRLRTGQHALLDGYNGVLILNPTDQTLFEYGQIFQRQARAEEQFRDLHDLPAITLDGARVILSANVAQTGDVVAVLHSGAEGIGLFRTEFLYINRDSLPTEEEQFQAYRGVAAAIQPQSLIIRTLDLGGDKFVSHLQLPREMNPFLGWRAIRFCLAERDIFRAQLRAILRASAEGNIKMMFPMISGVEEFTQAMQLVEEYKRELKSENHAFDENLEVGAMIEIPSAVITADALARRVDFFSVGTNDLIQYAMAVDRLNERIAHLYEPTHPAILRLIKSTIDAGHAQGVWTGVCGEMAGDPVLVPLLLGLGVDELSVAPPLAPAVKFVIRRVKMSEARELAEFALSCESASDILRRCHELVARIAPSLFENLLSPTSK